MSEKGTRLPDISENDMVCVGNSEIEEWETPAFVRDSEFPRTVRRSFSPLIQDVVDDVIYPRAGIWRGWYR